MLAVWAAAALPMAALSWVGAPLLARAFTGPTALPRALILALLAGLVWQFLLVLLVVHREQGSLRWPVREGGAVAAVPRGPAHRQRGGRLWWVVVPMVVLLGPRGDAADAPHPPSTGPRAAVRVARRAVVDGGPGVVVILVVQFTSTPCSGRSCCSAGSCCRGWGGLRPGRLGGQRCAVRDAYHLHVPWVIPQTLSSTPSPWPAGAPLPQRAAGDRRPQRPDGLLHRHRRQH